MLAASFALAGTLLGIIGALAIDFARSRRDARAQQSSALRAACVEFLGTIEQMRHLTYELNREPSDTDLRNRILDTHMRARSAYEQLRLSSYSAKTQEAGRYVLRYAYGILRLAYGRDLRDDERDKHPIQLLGEWQAALLVEVRRELGYKDVSSVFAEPREWMTFPGFVMPGEPPSDRQ